MSEYVLDRSIILRKPKSLLVMLYRLVGLVYYSGFVPYYFNIPSLRSKLYIADFH